MKGDYRMNARNWPGHWPYPYSNPNHYPNPNPINVSGQNPEAPYPNYGYAPTPYGYPTWGYYGGPAYWPPQAPMPSNSIQTSSVTPMMPPNGEPYQHNFQEEPYKEMWESPQSPQSPWIRAFEKHETDEN